jgi:16S rRNA processing protein RimM
VGRPHGLDGSFVVEEASDDPSRFAVGATVYANREPAAIVAAKRAGGRLVIRLDRPVARGTELTVPISQLPPLGEGEYYVFQLVGLAVVEEGGRALGTVVGVAPGVANDVLELDTGVALPLVEQCVLGVDLAGGRIVVASGLVGSE